MLNTFLAIYIYLISSGPGTHAYTWYGHTAVEVIDTQRNIDVCFNYGFFSFHSKNFYGNFVKGRTYYELLVERTDDFYEDCKYECRGNIIRQELNLTEEKKREFVQALFINALPANSRYLYNFVYDNCATRPYKLIKHLLGDTLISSYSGFEGQTYRQFIQRYSRKGSWFDLGINLIFGYRSDKKMYGEARLFLPEALMFYMEEARYNDSIPLVTSSNIHAFDIMPVPWYKTFYILFIHTIDNHKNS